MPYSISYCYIGWIIHRKYHDIVGSDSRVTPKDTTCKIKNDCVKYFLSNIFGPQRRGHFEFEKFFLELIFFMYIYHANTKMTHKNYGFIENLMKVPASQIMIIYI